MADLIDRIGSDAPVDGRGKIAVHQFIGAERLYALGYVSRAEVASDWDLQGDEVTQAAAIADSIDAQANASAKMVYIARVEAIFMLLEHRDDGIYHLGDGSVDRAKAIADLGI